MTNIKQLDEFAIVCKSILDVGVELGRGSLMGKKKVDYSFKQLTPVIWC
jgi:hypothetical protein